MHKASVYNFVFRYPEYEKIILYNSLTNATLLIKPTEFEYAIRNILSDPNSFCDSENLKQDLIDQRFLVPTSTNELDTIKERYALGVKKDSALSITIACTIQCNFRCTYCFEPHKNVYLSEENFKKLYSIIEAKAPQLKELDITWFGGEPLLMAEKIEFWSQKILTVVDRHAIKYRASIVTNGSLLNKKNIEHLKKSRIGAIQVTIDGPRKLHDVKRPSVGGGGTYDRIVNNLVENTIDLNTFNISIRVNVDQNNLSSVESLLRDLKLRGLSRSCFIYFARVENPTEYCGDIDSQCFTSKSFSQEIVYLNGLKEKYGFEQAHSPKPVFAFCAAVAKNAFVIDASGDIYRCWHDVGSPAKREATIDDVWKKVFSLGEYARYSPYDDEECIRCKVLPLCQGNCPYYRLPRGLEIVPKKRCTELKFNLKDHLATIYKHELSAQCSPSLEQVDA